MKNKNCITLTIIFKASSLNYGEGIGNISELKKITAGNGKVYTFASRQALRYDIVRLGHEMYHWNLQTVDKAKGTVQFKENVSIQDSEEMDLFGYMKTKRKNSEEDNGGSDIRSAVVRMSNAISLEEYKGDMDFLNNKGLADRIDEFPNLANIEQHLSFYTYTITIDLSKVGVDGKLELDNSQKEKRVKELLEIIKLLNRNIRGREENLSPLLVIGGMYQMNTPFFLGRMKLIPSQNGFSIDTDILKDTLNLKVSSDEIKKDTNIGMVKNVFCNDASLSTTIDKELLTIQEFFDDLGNKVSEYYSS